MSVSGSKVLFDASRLPGFEEKKKRVQKATRLILLQGMVVTPLIFALVWVMLEVVVDSGIDPLLLGAIFIVLIILEELLMWNMVRPMLLKAWQYPATITTSGVEFGGRSIPFRDIGALTRYDQYLTIGIAGKDAKFPIMDGQVVDPEGFVNAFRQQAPNVPFKDMR